MWIFKKIVSHRLEVGKTHTFANDTEKQAGWFDETIFKQLPSKVPIFTQKGAKNLALLFNMYIYQLPAHLLQTAE